MSGDGSNGVGNVALGASMGGGMIATVNEYAIIIGLTLSLVSLVIGVYFHIQTIKWRKKQDARDRKILRDEIIQELSHLEAKADGTSKPSE